MDDKLTHIILTDHALRYGLDGKSAYEIAQKYGYEEPNRNMQKDLSSQKTKLIRLLIVRIRLLNVQKNQPQTPTSRPRVRNLWPTTLRRSWMSGAQILGFLGRGDQRLRNLGIPGGRRHYRAAGRGFCRFAGCCGRDDVPLRGVDLADANEHSDVYETLDHPLRVGSDQDAVLLSGGLQDHRMDATRGE